MEIINLNLIPTGTRPVVHASQYDNGRQFRANLFEGASVYTLTGAETLTFSVRKPDGHIVTEAVTNTSDNYVVIETTTQMCACAGDSFAELKIENGDDLIGTLNLILAVEQSPEEGGDPSESFIHNLEEQIYDAVADQYDSNNVIFDNTPTTGHGIGYTVTSEGILNAIPDDLDDLSDVTTTTPSSGEALVWDGTKWVNGTPTLDVDDLNDVTITTPTDGEILVYNNGTWENQANPASTANFGPDYDENTTYNTGDKVIYQGLFYVCNDDNVTGTWDATKWDAFTVADLNGKNIPMSTTEPTSMVADRIEACETALGNKASKSWTYVDTIVDGGQGCDLSGYNEVLVIPYVNNNSKYNSFVYPIAEISGAVITIVGSTTHKYVGSFTLSASNILTVTDVAITVWTSCYMRIWAR